MDDLKSVELSGSCGTGASRPQARPVLLAVLSFASLLFGHRLVLDVYHGDEGSSSIQANKGNVSQHEIPFCNRSQLQQGRWVESNVTPVYDLHNEACYNSDYNGADSYDWEPHDHRRRSCLFEPWDAAKFCSLLKGAPILFVGDSLTFEHYVTLVNGLGGITRKAQQMVSFRRHITIVQSVCDHHQTFVMFRRDDSLSRLGRYLKETFPVVLVLNRGAHYEPDEKLLPDLERTFLEVEAWQRQCKEYGIKCHFFWRTTVPGHPDCRNFTEPVNNLTLIEELVASSGMATNFHWPEFKHQNELVLDTLENKTNLDYQVIDAYYSNILRPDQHARPVIINGWKTIDCLHSCSPGKVDVYNRFLWHSLIQTRTIEDVRALEQFSFLWNRTSNVKPDGNII
eukprot:scaffold13682_cov102-Cylindrotheca_fusiformis.AAC.1